MGGEIVVTGILAADNMSHVAAVGLLITFPFVLPYVLAVAILVLRVIQWPVERYITSQAARALARHPAVKIAIAGSFGKTSMREILKTVLAEGKKVAAPPGSYNTPLGIAQFVRTLSGDEDVLIFEFGEYYPGDVRKLCELVEPHLGIITGINEAHLEKFKTIERTAATIFELADYLSEGPVYVNGENELARSIAPRDSIFYTRDGARRWRAKNASTNLAGTTFILESGDEKIEVHSELLGLHMLGSLAAASDIASRVGLTNAQIRSGLARTQAFEHRLEKRTDSAGVITLDDSYNGNPDGVRAVIDFLSSLTGRRRWYVTPGLVEMGPRKREVHNNIGRELAAAGIEKVVLIRNSVTPLIEEGLKESGYTGEIIWFDEGLAAYAALPHMTVAGDVVLLQNDWPDQYA